MHSTISKERKSTKKKGAKETSISFPRVRGGEKCSILLIEGDEKSGNLLRKKGERGKPARDDVFVRRKRESGSSPPW